MRQFTLLAVLLSCAACSVDPVDTIDCNANHVCEPNETHDVCPQDCFWQQSTEAPLHRRHPIAHGWSDLVSLDDNQTDFLKAPIHANEFGSDIGLPVLAWTNTDPDGLHYRDSPLSAGKAGELRGGDRMPWLASADNYAPLARLDLKPRAPHRPPHSLRPHSPV